MIQALTVVALILIGICAAEAWLFVARHARTHWWANGEGRYLMRSKIALALLFTMTLVFEWVRPQLLTRIVISDALFLFTAYTLADLLILQSKAKRERSRSQ